MSRSRAPRVPVPEPVPFNDLSLSFRSHGASTRSSRSNDDSTVSLVPPLDCSHSLDAPFLLLPPLPFTDLPSRSLSLRRAAEPAGSAHKRVINYLRVGHVFPPMLPPPPVYPRLHPKELSASVSLSVRLLPPCPSRTRRVLILLRYPPRRAVPCLHTRSYVNSA